MNFKNFRIAIILSVLAFFALIGVQYFLVWNTYQLKHREFKLMYWDSLLTAYEDCIDGGILYNDAYMILDTMSRNFKQQIITTTSEVDSIQEQEQTDFFKALVETLIYHDDLQAFFDDYAASNNLSNTIEYAIIIRHIGIFVSNTRERVIYDDQEGSIFSGGLRDYGSYSNIMDSRTVVNNNCLIDYSLYVDTPSRQYILLQQMGSTFLLSFLTLLTTFGALLFTIKNWMRQKQLSDMKSDFINNMNHELKTPLSTIAIANKSLQQDAIRNNPQKANKMLTIIDRQTHRLQMLIDEVLDLAIGKQKSFKINPSTTQLNPFLQAVINDYKVKTAEQNVQIITNFAATNNTVNLDDYHFTSVVLNLLDNAVKYNEDAVHINIKTLNKLKCPKQIFITINDNGIGMGKTTLAHLFDKFYRGQKGNIYNHKGLGIGLYYVQQLVQAHGGTITVTSKLGKGSTFEISLPIV